ncbi:PREDICTED: uncharacterized protein LOC104821388 [Tarenaya hassleriana]|uniref:uncharacterized protein LOC104821388 n=1 Tax=Tarenaya hassleriana TaxID=28532 RepID=UPI00053C4443|nr:PREDICTED: uncharacterized protein LOC104821388 [Tarenaya hassleriana]
MSEEIQEHPPTAPPPPPRKGGLISLRRQLFLAGVMVFLAVKGLAGVEEIAFVVFSYVYLYIFLSRFAFPPRKNEQRRRFSNPNAKLFRAYFLATAVFGLIFPICYIGDGIFRGDLEGARAASKHLFLLCGQSFMEPIGFSDKFSMPIGILGPVFSNARRVFALLDWIRAEFSPSATERPGGPMRVYGGRALASANILIWSFNLFGLLLPVFLPRACEIYFSADKID